MFLVRINKKNVVDGCGLTSLGQKPERLGVILPRRETIDSVLMFVIFVPLRTVGQNSTAVHL